MSETPRTQQLIDIANDEGISDAAVALVLQERSEQLEREIAELVAEKNKQLAEARADAEHWKSECNALQRMVHEAQAEIKLKNEELDMFWAEQQAMGEIIECKNKLIEQMLEALEAARLFIENGIEMGYISEPQPGTPESATLPAIIAAIKAAKGEI